MSSGSNFYQHLYFASLLLFLTPNLFYFCLFYFIFQLLQSTVRTLMVTLSLPRTHGLSLWSPQSSLIGFRSFRRSYVAASSSAFANENRESVSDFIFLCLLNFEFEVEIDDVSQFLVIFVFLFWWRFVIVGGGNAAGYAARTFVEHDMANGRLCIVSKEVHLFIFSLCKFSLLGH